MKDVFYNQEVVRVSEQNLKKFKESEQNLYVILALFISCHETPHSFWFDSICSSKSTTLFHKSLF